MTKLSSKQLRCAATLVACNGFFVKTNNPENAHKPLDRSRDGVTMFVKQDVRLPSATRIFSIPVTGFHYGLTHCQSTPSNNQSAKLEKIIPPVLVRSRREATERLDTWVIQSTKDFQILDYGPKDWAVMVAFINLIGIHQVPLGQLSHVIQTRQCFINSLSLSAQRLPPKLVLSAEDALSGIHEFNVPKHQVKLISLDSTIQYPLEHARNSLLVDASKTINKGSINALYRAVADLSDEDIDAFVEYFIPHASLLAKQDLNTRLIDARELCIEALSLSKSHDGVI